MEFFDTYSMKARLFPAILVAAPAFILLFLAGSWQSPGLPEILSGLAVGVLFFAIGDLARRAGQRAQKKLFQLSGSYPVNRELSFADSTLDTGTKTRFLTFLSAQIGEPAPTRESELSNPAAANAFYERSFTYLRNNTHDTDRFRLLFNENINYGFRRNLYGLKPYGIAINLAAVAGAIGMFALEPSFANITQGELIVQGGLALLHALYFIFAVTAETVRSAALSYGLQLTMSCDTLILESQAGR